MVFQARCRCEQPIRTESPFSVVQSLSRFLWFLLLIVGPNLHQFALRLVPRPSVSMKETSTFPGFRLPYFARLSKSWFTSGPFLLPRHVSVVVLALGGIKAREPTAAFDSPNWLRFLAQDTRSTVPATQLHLGPGLRIGWGCEPCSSEEH
jgi:hypothetical protein